MSSQQALRPTSMCPCTHGPCCHTAVGAPTCPPLSASLQVILSVPLTAAITSEGVDEGRWSTHMAAELLRRQAAAAAAAAGGGGSGGAAAAKSAAPWLAALPAYVDLPWLYWSDAELAELQDEDTLGEAQHLRSVFEAACEVGGRVWQGGQGERVQVGRRSTGFSHRLASTAQPPQQPSVACAGPHASLRPCPQELAGSYSREQVAWALSMVHSRR